MDADTPRTRDEVIDRVQIEWAALEHVVSRLSEEQLTTPGHDVWSVKDHLAHIAEWERALVAVLAGRPQSEGFGIDATSYAQLDDNLDRLNDVLYQRHRDASVSAVLADARRAHAEVLAALGRLSNADLNKTIAEYGGDAQDDRPLLDKIAGDTYAHYVEHNGWINELFAHLE